MKVLVTESFNTAKGNIPVGKVIDIPETMFNRLKGKVEATSPKHGTNTMVIWRNPYPKGTPEARKESLCQIMMAIWESSLPETRVAESEGLIMQQEIMAGRGKLIDFREACEKWKKAETK
jgi:hypothetical protein